MTARPGPKRTGPLLLSLLACGALMACSTPPMNVYPMAWLGLVGFYLLLGSAERSGASSAPGPLGAPAAPAARAALRDVGRMAGLGLVFGIGTNLVALRFVSAVVLHFAQVPAFVGPLSVLVIAIFEGLRLAIAAAAYAALVRLRVPRVLAFGIGIYVGTLMPSMIPWTVACGVAPWPATVQLAELVGERGVAFLMAVESALAGEAFVLVRARETARARGHAAAAGALVAATLAYGFLRMSQIDARRAAAPKESIALVVAGIEATERWDRASAKSIVERLSDLTRTAEHDGAALVIWPEAAYPFIVPHVSRHAPMGDTALLQPGVRGPILTGVILSGSLGRYNSAVIATADGKLSEPYDKMHLMWFGEAVPLEDQIPWLRKAFARGIGLRAGEHQVALEAAPARIAVLNCLEDILPGAGREAMAIDPNLLVNLTNDAWFAGTAESAYHVLLSRLRTIETRRDLLRAVNYGPTAWIDATGRIRAVISGDAPGILMTEPALLEGQTLYARAGEWPLAVLLALLVTAGVVSNRAPTRSKS